MAISVVQHTNGTSASAGSIPLTLNGVQAGSALLYLLTYTRDGTAHAVTPPTGFTLAGSSTITGSVSGYASKLFAFYALNVASGTHNVTTALAGDDYAHATLIEVSGLDPTNALDVAFAGATANNNTPASGSSPSTAQADELIIAMLGQLSTQVITIGVPTTGYTLIDEEENSSAITGSSHAYKIVSATGAQSAAWTSNRSAPWTTMILSFKGAAAGGGGVSGAANITMDAATAAGTAQAKLAAALTYSLAPASVTASGVLPVVGAGGGTLGALMASGEADNPVTGAFAATLGAATVSATASATVRATASPGLVALALSATGRVGVSGGLTATLAGVTVSAVASLPVRVFMDYTLAPATVTGATGSGQNGQANITLGAATAQGTLKVLLSASATYTLAQLTGSAAGTVATHGVAILALGGATASGTLSDPGEVLGQGGGTFAPASVTATATVRVSAACTVTLDGASCATLGVVRTSGQALPALQPLTSAASAAVRVTGAGEATLGPVTVFGTAFAGQIAVFGLIQLTAGAETRVSLSAQWSSVIQLDAAE